MRWQAVRMQACECHTLWVLLDSPEDRLSVPLMLRGCEDHRKWGRLRPLPQNLSILGDVLWCAHLAGHHVVHSSYLSDFAF